MARVRLPIRKKSSRLSSADSDSTSGSSKSVKSQPFSSKKRKITEEGHVYVFGLIEGAADCVSNFLVPPELYHLIREAVVLRDHLKTNKNDMDSILDLESAEGTIRIFAKELKKFNGLPHNWKYDPAAANTYESSSSLSLELEFNDLLEDDDLLEGRVATTYDEVFMQLLKIHNNHVASDHCCAPFKNPLEWYANTDDVPLSRTEKKIWKEFQKFDKRLYPGLTAISFPGFEKEKMPIKIDNPIVSLIGNFAIAAFNEVIEKYVKEGEHKNLRDFEFMECAYIKMRGTEYFFYMTIEAIEEGKLGVYETKVRLEWDDGSKSLCKFVLTDRTPRGKKKRVKRDWLYPMEDKYTGMRLRSKSASCMGYDYSTPWRFGGP
ncbi:ribosomal 40S subunit protein S13 [Orobanche minor]